MNGYNELYEQFSTKQEDSKVDEKSIIQYQQIFNSIRAENTTKKKTKQKLLIQKSTLKLTNANKDNKDSLIRSSSSLNALTTRSRTLQNIKPAIITRGQQSRLTINSSMDNNNTFYQQKKAIIQMQKQSLSQQIDNLIKMVNNMKQQKIFLKDQLKILTVKQEEMTILLNENVNDIEMLYCRIKEQKEQNDRDVGFYQQHKGKLTLKLQNIKQQNEQHSSKYKQKKQICIQKNQNDFIGGILQWKNEENRLKRIEKKLYTKNKIQEMLRTLYITKKLAQSNYGNIIQHLIKIAESDKVIRGNGNKGGSDNNINYTSKDINDENFYINENNGEQLPINEVIKRLQSTLLTPAQCRMLSKYQIFEYYQKKHGIVVLQSPAMINMAKQKNTNKNTNNPTKKTITTPPPIIHQLTSHYQKITSWFSRVQNRNQQLSQYYQSLIKIDQQLNKQIMSIQMSSQQKNMTYLQARQGEICKIEQGFHQQCKVIFMLNINVYDLVRRFQSLNRFFEGVVGRGQSGGDDAGGSDMNKNNQNQRTIPKRTYVQNESDTQFLKAITRVLFKSPQSIVMQWNKVINANKNNNNNNYNNNTSKRRKSNINDINANNSSNTTSRSFYNNSNNSNNNNLSTPMPMPISNNNPNTLSITSTSFDNTNNTNNNQDNNNNNNNNIENTSQNNKEYFQTIMKNDLLRIYAQPKLYDERKSVIDNLQYTFQYVIQEEVKIVQRLMAILKGLLMFAKRGMEGYYSRQQDGRKSKGENGKEGFQIIGGTGHQRQKQINFDNNKNDNLTNALFNLLKQQPQQLKVPASQPQTKSSSSTQFKFNDKFFKKDQVKQQELYQQLQQKINNNNNNNISFQTNINDKNNDKNDNNNNINTNYMIKVNNNNFCVQSNDYYRRDNFKIIQKLQKLNLKKRGLLPNVPFFNDTTLELQPIELKSTLNRTMTQKSILRTGTGRNSYKNVRSPRVTHEIVPNRHNMLSQRRQRQSTRRKDLKMLLANISNIASQNNKYRIKKNINLNSNSNQTLGLSRAISSSGSRLRTNLSLSK